MPRRRKVAEPKEVPSTLHEYTFPLKTEAELKQFIWDAFGVRVPDKQVCPNHVSPFQIIADAYFARYPVIVVKASRGFAGKSFNLGLLGLVEALTLKCDVNIIGGSGDQSEKVLAYVNTFASSEGAATLGAYDPANDNTIPLLPHEGMKAETMIGWGNRIRAFEASQTAVRSPHCPRLRLDEADSMDLKILDAALGQTMSADGVVGQTLISSTHQNAQGTFTEVLKRAAEKGWKFHEYCIDGDSVIMGIDKNILMKDIKIGDKIYAHSKGRLIETQVTNAWCSGIKPTLIVRTTSGTIRCTTNHRVLTARGWKQVGQLQVGERVFGVPQAPLDKSQSAQNRAVSEMYECTAEEKKTARSLSRVQEGYYYRGSLQKDRLMPTMPNCQKSQRGRKNMPSMRELETIRLSNLPLLLSPKNEPSQYQRGGQHSKSQAQNSLGWRTRYTNFWRVGNETIARTLARVLRGARSVWALCGGLRLAGIQNGHRGEWALLAYASTTNPERPIQKETRDRNGLDARFSLGRRTPPLALGVVQSITPSNAVPVYDLSVAKGESFIANGVVAHNCYRETLEPHGWLPQSEVERKKIEVTDVMWKVEYEGQEPSPESRAIQPQFVDAMFDRSLGEFLGAPFEYIEIEPPQPEGVYATGADFARKKDFTVITTLRCDVYPMKLVAFERLNKVEWPVMIAKFDARIQRYSGFATFDGTGLGDVAAGYLHEPALPFIFTARTKADAMSKYIRAIELGEIKAPYIAYMDAEHRYASFDDVYVGQAYNSHTPDSMIAGALAYMGALPSKQGIEWTRQMQEEGLRRAQTQSGIALPNIANPNDWGEVLRRVQGQAGENRSLPLSPLGSGVQGWGMFGQRARR